MEKGSSQVQMEFSRPGEGLSLPEALPAVESLDWDRDRGLCPSGCPYSLQSTLLQLHDFDMAKFANETKSKDI